MYEWVDDKLDIHAVDDEFILGIGFPKKPKVYLSRDTHISFLQQPDDRMTKLHFRLARKELILQGNVLVQEI